MKFLIKFFELLFRGWNNDFSNAEIHFKMQKLINIANYEKKSGLQLPKTSKN